MANDKTNNEKLGKDKTNGEKMKALDAVLLQIEKQYGKGSIMRLGDAAGHTEIEVIPTGCLTLDLALGIGGMPRGRIIEIYGPESSGKTTVALHAIAQTQNSAAWRRSSTRSTRWIPYTRKNWASIWTICTCHSPTRANRRSTSRTRL